VYTSIEIKIEEHYHYSNEEDDEEAVVHEIQDPCNVIICNIIIKYPQLNCDLV